MDEEMADTAVEFAVPETASTAAPARGNRDLYLIVVLCSALIYLACIIAPPYLQDDVDAVQAQIARNMLDSGDWVTAHLNGVIYIEKAPLVYWLIAISYKIFGVHDWAARIPIALSVMALCWLTAAMGVWAFGRKAGLYAGLTISVCVGLFLFTRILIPDVMLTGTIALAMWAFLRALEEDEPHPRAWAAVLAAGMGVGLLLKSLIGMVFPIGAGLVYLALTGQLFARRTWQRLHPFTGALIALAIAAPWHVLATLRNPPYFDFTLHSERGAYHGFLWFYFINEQLLRFLNLRYPRDYSTVPRLYFWLFHLLWLFPFSVYFPALVKLSYRPSDRAGRMRLLALCWAGFVLVFFTFSTTQEYYSMPVYPALALLLGSAMATGGAWINTANKVLSIICAACFAASVGILVAVRDVPAVGDISQAVTKQANYRLSLGHMQDLTLHSFAYLRWPLAMAALAFLIGAVGLLVWKNQRAFVSAVLMMILFYQAARLAMTKFDPYLSSHALAAALEQLPDGQLIAYGHYYPFSSVFFYSNRKALLWNGVAMNLVYGAFAPGAPNVFLDDAQFAERWRHSQHNYLILSEEELPHLKALVNPDSLFVVQESGGKYLFSNQAVALRQ
jgi:4-amino-4-deoxy-L-arabinose transferase-like glycosyltransferase